jgi:N-acetylmuramoyl-L-alanine amidase
LIRRSHFIWLLALILLGLSPAAEEKRLAVYTPQTGFTVPVTDHDSLEYVSVTDLLDPFGQATLKKDGKRWRLHFEASGKTIDGEFSDESDQAKIRGKKIRLGHPFWADNGRGYIPLTASPALLAQFVPGSSYLRENSRRLFIGDVATTFTADLQKGNPSKLVLHFSAPVNPSVATEPGHVRFSFAREPLVSTGQPQTFDDPLIRSSVYNETNGSSEIAVTTGVPVTASFSDGNRTITLTPVPVQAAAVPPAPTLPPAPTNAAPGTSAAQTPQPAAPLRFLVVVDPAHGGTDPGAALGGGLFEKDVTLAVARRIRTELDQRGIATQLLRDGDATLTLDQRAIAANASRAALYIAVHADSLGSGVRLYTSRNSSVPSSQTLFVPWDQAQTCYVDQSRNLAASLKSELESRRVKTLPLESSLRPLRNLAKPAIAIELAPPDNSTEGLTSVAYEQSVATATAAAVAKIRGSLEAQP